MKATYLYCVIRSARKPAVSRAPEGIAGSTALRAIPVATSLWLIATDVPLEIYGSDELERRLADLDWVGRVALAHEDVVEHFAGRRGLTVIPLKLFTLFSSDERAVSDVRAHRAAIGRVMRRIGGAEEWGVRITTSGAAPKADSTGGQPSTGKEFLAARKKARDATRDGRARAAASALDAYDDLVRVARDARRRDEVPASGTVPLLDAAFLVPVASRSEFTRAARRHAALCARAGARMTLTGPWPAYNFVRSDEPPA